MTHYEELGVSPDATPEEIRRAYRQLSRLLHPDRQRKPELRQAAETQMRRLNEVVALLCHSERRAAYDRSLQGEPWPVPPPLPPPLPPPTLTPAAPGAGSLLAALFLGGLLVFCLLQFWPASPPLPLASNELPAAAIHTPSTAFPSPASISRPAGNSAVATPLVAAASPRDPSAALAPDSSSASLAPPPPSELRPALTPLEMPSPLPFAAPPSLPAPRHPTLSGIWLSARKAPTILAPGEYVAEFVELKLRESGSRLEGDFRSRYRIHDRLSSPELNFRFSGSPQQQHFEWTGAQGSRGKLRLLLEQANVLTLEWVAEVSAPSSLLAEGSAKLLRRQD